MIRGEFVPEEEPQPVDSPFMVNGCDDRTAFFNMDLGFGQQQQQQVPEFRDIGGFMPGFGSSFGSNVMTPPNAPQAQGPPHCNGNCDACAFSFLCKSAAKKLTTPGGGFVPRLG